MMDPIALTTSIIEVALEVKKAIDTLVSRRNRAKELANDVLTDLLRIAAFYEGNRTVLSRAALGPLCDSLDAVKCDLHRIHGRCRAYERKEKEGLSLLKGFALGLKLWMDSEQIETDLVRLKERIQASFNCITFLSCARMEVGLMRFEETVLVKIHESRERITQLDRIFAEKLINGEVNMASFNPRAEGVDYADIQYVRAKAMKIVNIISETTLVMADFKPCQRQAYYRSNVSWGARASRVVSSVAHLWSEINCRNACEGAPQEYTPVVHTTRYNAGTFDKLGLQSVALAMLGALETHVRCALHLSSLQLPPRITEDQDEAFAFLEEILYQRAYCALNSLDKQDADCTLDEDEAFKHASDAAQLSRGLFERKASPTSHHHARLIKGLLPFIRFIALGRAEECISHSMEALEHLHACGFSVTREIVNGFDASLLQLHAAILHSLSKAQQLNNEYTLAYHTGLECVSSIRTLLNINPSLVPVDFYYFDDVLKSLELELPSLTSIVRNPESQSLCSKEYVDVDDVEDGFVEQIQWGVAI